jgi:hypothetical protein
MTDAVKLVAGRRSGVHWAGTAPDASALRRAAAAAGLGYARIAGEGVRDKAALLEAVAGALGFPAYFGRNWDALEDGLRDLSWLAGDGAVLLWTPVDPLVEADPDAWRVALDVLRDVAAWWAGEGRPFLAVLGGARRPPGLGGARTPRRGRTRPDAGRGARPGGRPARRRTGARGVRRRPAPGRASRKPGA